MVRQRMRRETNEFAFLSVALFGNQGLGLDRTTALSIIFRLCSDPRIQVASDTAAAAFHSAHLFGVVNGVMMFVCPRSLPNLHRRLVRAGHRLAAKAENFQARSSLDHCFQIIGAGCLFALLADREKMSGYCIKRTSSPKPDCGLFTSFGHFQRGGHFPRIHRRVYSNRPWTAIRNAGTGHNRSGVAPSAANIDVCGPRRCAAFHTLRSTRMLIGVLGMDQTWTMHQTAKLLCKSLYSVSRHIALRAEFPIGRGLVGFGSWSFSRKGSQTLRPRKAAGRTVQTISAHRPLPD